MEQSSPTKKEVNIINSRPSLNQELLFFKNEILGDLKQLENKLLRKIEQRTDSSQKKMVQIETSLDTLTKKIFNMSNFFSENITIKDKLDNLFQSRTKIEETIYSHEYQLSSIAKDLVTAINKYDKIIEKSIYYPGLIGASNSKFNTFHNFIDYVMLNINQLNHFKDKTMGIDLKQYKNRLEATIEGFKKQTEEIITNNKIYTSKLIKNLDNKFKNDFELYDQRLFNLKLKNTEQVIGIEKLSKNLINELNGITDMKKNIEKSYETSIQILRWHYIYTENRMNQCVKDYEEINKRIILIIEALKGMKGGSIPNLPEILKEFGNIGDNKKEYHNKIKAESLLKKYIVGEMDMEQISQLSKKNSGKVAFNENNMIKSNIFEDNINSNNLNNKGKFSRMNTRSFIKYDSSHRLNFNKDNIKSESKNNNINIFSSQKIVLSKKSQEFGNKLSASINLKSQKNFNSELNDKKRLFNKMESTFFNDKKLSSRLIGPKRELSPKSQLLELKNTKSIFDEKLSLNDAIQQKSSVWSKDQKNNIYLDKERNIIKESQSEYKNELIKTVKERKEETKEEQKSKNIKEENNLKLSSKQENEKNVEKLNSIVKVKNDNPEKSEKNKDIDKLKISPRDNQEDKILKPEEDRISNLDNQTILSTITEHNILTPRSKEEKEQEKFEEIVNNKNEFNKNLNDNKVKHNIKSASNIKEIKQKEKNEKYEKQEKGLEMTKETNIEKDFKNKENNTNLRLINFEYDSRNEDATNIKNIHLPSEKTFKDINIDSNNYYFEIENKTQENLNDKGIDNISINTGSKIGLHKLLIGDRNALNSFKLMNNGEDIRIPKLSSEYENKGNNKNYNTNNIISTKSRTNKDIRSASSVNFFKNNNKINKDFKFDMIENLFENNLDDFFKGYVENTDFNNINPLLEQNTQDITKDKNSRVHIVHIPAISQSQRNKNKEYSKDALSRIEALRKIKNDNNTNISNKNRINKSNENLRDKQFGKLKLNNKLIRTYEGFNM